MSPAAVPLGAAAGAGLASTAGGAANGYPGMPQSYRYAQLPDSVRHAMATRDSLLHVAMQDTSAAGKAHVDSLRHAYAQADTAGRAAQMRAIQASVPVAAGVVLAPGGGTAPDLSAGAQGAVQSPSSMSVNANAPAKSAPLPGPPMIGPAAVAAHAGPDSTHAAMSDTSSHHAGLSPGATAAGAAAGASLATTSKSGAAKAAPPPPAKAAAPKPPPGGPISSLWVNQTKAERDSLKHVKFEADSLAKAEKAAKKAEKKAKKSGKNAPAPAPAPAVMPAPPPTTPDSAKAGQH
jgi:hypothetical protein